MTKKNRPARSLSLSTSTLRSLSTPTLVHVAGGASQEGCQTGQTCGVMSNCPCVSLWCPSHLRCA